MQKLFFEYYRPSEQEFKKLWNDGLFIFDTNILLNLYRYSFDTSKKLLEIFSDLNERIWIPHQVAFEYHENRLTVISEQERSYDTIMRILDKSYDELKENLKNYSRHPFLNIEKLSESVRENFDKIKNDLQDDSQNHPNWFDEDKICNELTKLFDGKVGDKYSAEKLKEIVEQGSTRYKNKIPPGYKDKKKKEDNIDDFKKYGDLIIWFQILDMAKECQKPILFITDDKKEDWWWKVSGKTVGPRYELIKEFFTKTNMQFYMYKVDQFIKYAADYLEREVNQDVIDEIKELRTTDENDRRVMDELLLKREIYDSELQLLELDTDLNSEFRKKRNRYTNISRELDFLKARKIYLEKEYKLVKLSISTDDLSDKDLDKNKSKLKTINSELADLDDAISSVESECKALKQELKSLSYKNEDAKQLKLHLDYKIKEIDDELAKYL